MTSVGDDDGPHKNDREDRESINTRQLSSCQVSTTNTSDDDIMPYEVFNATTEINEKQNNIVDEFLFKLFNQVMMIG